MQQRFRHFIGCAFVTAFLGFSTTHLVGQDQPAKNPAEEAAIQKVESFGGSVRKIALSSEWREASYYLSDKDVTDEALAPLNDIPELVWLYLQGTKVTDDGLQHLSGIESLQKLHLERTGITDAGLAHLSSLTNLEYLNLYGTKVTDAGLDHLTKLGKLKKLYVWETGVTDSGIAKLKESLHDVDVISGVKLATPQPADEKPEPAKESLAQGSAVRIRLSGEGKILSLAEVQVFQTGDNAELHRAGEASQSSVDYDGEAKRAVDGNTEQVYQKGSVTHTKSEPNPWWRVNLGGVKEVGRIVVWNRGDCCGDRLAGAVVEVLADEDKVVWSGEVTDAKDASVHTFQK
ncbi:MAG: discoidin domain-containing protein [Planctomycetales bacterium]|nr:discoidin domain-containing protein [Planctomycetales bacterium]